MTKIQTRIRGAVALGALGAAMALGTNIPAQAAAVPAEPGAAAVADTPTPSSSHYLIRTLTKERTMVPNLNGDIVMRNMSGINPFVSHQLWHFNSYANGAYEVRNHNEGCLDTENGGSKIVGSKVTFRACDGTPSQRWFSSLSHGGWSLQNQWSGLLATVNGSGNNASVTQQENNGIHSLQRFDMPFHSTD